MSESNTIRCRRCAREAPQLDRPPMPGAFGEEIHQGICGACWTEWQRAEVMVINELRLDFMDPRSLAILERHAREFLMLPES